MGKWMLMARLMRMGVNTLVTDSDIYIFDDW
jgi:hypothetical protein